jgi:putative transposase
MRYRRADVMGGTYFFTVNLAERKRTLLVDRIDVLRTVMRKVKAMHPFHIDAMVVLPDHLHAMWTLPEGDADYPTRWALIKAGFSRHLPKDERRNPSRIAKGERGIWQRRYWEHVIRDERDYARHVDYIHYNPVKHGYVNRVADWPHSTFQRDVERGLYPLNWAGVPESELETGERVEPHGFNPRRAQ